MLVHRAAARDRRDISLARDLRRIVTTPGSSRGAAVGSPSTRTLYALASDLDPVAGRTWAREAWA
jgi:hypothetical protein